MYAARFEGESSGVGRIGSYGHGCAKYVVMLYPNEPRLLLEFSFSNKSYGWVFGNGRRREVFGLLLFRILRRRTYIRKAKFYRRKSSVVELRFIIGLYRESLVIWFTLFQDYFLPILNKYPRLFWN